jgi:uncharacterized protein YdhG (YjbR/CyaY superfamily)
MTNPIDDYFAQFTGLALERLEQMRATIRAAAPDASEAMKYGLPTFIGRGNLVHYGAFKEHTGFYPTPSGIEAFKDELAPYAGAKGSVRFPHSQPLPLDLVRRIVEFRLAEQRAGGK